MGSVAVALAFVAGICVVWATVASLCMGVWLTHHGVRVRWLLFRALMPWYVHRYQRMHQQLKGRVGPLLPQFVVLMSLALLFAVAALIALAAAAG